MNKVTFAPPKGGLTRDQKLDGTNSKEIFSKRGTHTHLHALTHTHTFTHTNTYTRTHTHAHTHAGSTV